MFGDETAAYEVRHHAFVARVDGVCETYLVVSQILTVEVGLKKPVDCDSARKLFAQSMVVVHRSLIQQFSVHVVEFQVAGPDGMVVKALCVMSKL